KLEGPSWTDCIFGDEEPVEFLGGPKDTTVLALLAVTGCQHLDLNLISAFAERWHDETSSFHMSALLGRSQ
ncbi:hypothetical protein A2U01_0049917, partial [Trifolium medium]|nr:hypothetical protein [Trifolium medium]